MFRQEVEQLFHEGVRQFSASDYAPAARTFEELVREYPESHRITAALLMEAKARYFLGMYRESVRLLRTLFDLYPESSYTDDAHYTLGLNYFRLRRYEEAAGEFLVALQTTDDKKLSTRSEEWLDQLASESLSIGHLQLLLAEASNDEAKALLTVHLAARIFRSGDAKTAEELIRPITQMPPRIRFVGEALKLLERISKGGVLKIGVLLPLVQNAQQESEKQAGQDLLEGVRFAVEEYNQAALPKLSLEIRDTEYDADIASRQTAELCADKDVVALVGPALSKEAFLSASIANYRGVPMVTPTATAQGIAATGKHIFQANPDFDVRGRALAQYAMSQLGARTVAVLAPDDEVGRAQTDAFLAEATANGADVVSVQWYTPDTTDLRQQLMAIRTGALQKLDRYFVDFTSKPRPTELEAMLQWGI
ncbi:MAG TPA: penicillin-binding protein activator, partial [Bacteroidota bacterium]